MLDPIGTLERVAVESWRVWCEMAPFLLVGFLVAGALSVCISAEWVERHLGRRGLSSVWKAAILGVPLPLCSCGVIPVAASMRRHGASRAAVTAFLLSTPQTGVDSIAATYALLGPVFAAFRPVAALISGLLGGVLVVLLGESKQERAAERVAPPACTEACCIGDRSRPALMRALSYGLVTLPRDVGGALLLGVLIAGLMGVLVPPHQLHAYLGGGILSILLLMAAGVPIYVCATASVPIAAGFMHMGASPGAALAFLIAGSVTNPATFTTVWKVLGRRTALLYLLSAAASAVGCGLLLDQVFAWVSTAAPQLDAHTHEMTHGGWLSTCWAAALLAVLAFSYFSAWRDRTQTSRQDHHERDHHEACHCEQE
jgi:hypothetical protein